MLNSIIPKTEMTKFIKEFDNKFKVNIKINMEISMANIFTEIINNDFE
mgnify:CR=1 FL=1